MQDERREQQNFHLNRDGHSMHSQGLNGDKWKGQPFLNRWLRISLRAQDKSSVFNNLLTHLNVETLTEAYNALDGTKALGVDQVSKKTYGKNLNNNLADLEMRIKHGSYKPSPKKEVLIPKSNGKMRPIAIACFEDKLVDYVVAKILTEVFEPMFIKNSFGFRPRKSAHDAIKACYYSLKDNKRPMVVEIDFTNFFNTIPHKKLMKIVEKKIADCKFKGVIRKFLKAPTLKGSGELEKGICGTPQGGLMSPILANIYLNEVVDQWFLKNHSSYNKIIVRYADDGVFFFKREDNAKKFLMEFKERIESFGLSLNDDKTHTINFNKNQNQSFNFLGFTFYWGKQNKKSFLKVKTQKEKLIKSIQEFYTWIKLVRNQMKLANIWKIACAKLRGHYNYFGFWMNGKKLQHFYFEAMKSLFKWLNRRSQKRSYTWEGFNERLKNQPLPEPKHASELMKLGRVFAYD